MQKTKAINLFKNSGLIALSKENEQIKGQLYTEKLVLKTRYFSYTKPLSRMKKEVDAVFVNAHLKSTKPLVDFLNRAIEND